MYTCPEHTLSCGPNHNEKFGHAFVARMSQHIHKEALSSYCRAFLSEYHSIWPFLKQIPVTKCLSVSRRVFFCYFSFERNEPSLKYSLSNLRGSISKLSGIKPNTAESLVNNKKKEKKTWLVKIPFFFFLNCMLWKLLYCS